MEQEVSRDEYLVEGIPFSIVYQEQAIEKPVIFFMHGFSSNRFLGPMGREYHLAKMGYTVLVMDAYNHGQRISEEYARLSNQEKQMLMVDIEIQTAKDACTLYRNLCLKGIISSNQTLAAYGVSMGAATAFYMATILDKLEVIVTLVGSPSFTGIYEYKQNTYGLDNSQLYLEKYANYNIIDPYQNYTKFLNKKLFMGVGTKDTVVPLHYAKKLSELIPCVYKEYDTGHESTPQMLEDAYSFLSCNIILNSTR